MWPIEINHRPLCITSLFHMIGHFCHHSVMCVHCGQCTFIHPFICSFIHRLMNMHNTLTPIWPELIDWQCDHLMIDRTSCPCHTNLIDGEDDGFSFLSAVVVCTSVNKVIIIFLPYDHLMTMMIRWPYKCQSVSGRHWWPYYDGRYLIQWSIVPSFSLNLYQQNF